MDIIPSSGTEIGVASREARKADIIRQAEALTGSDLHRGMKALVAAIEQVPVELQRNDSFSPHFLVPAAPEPPRGNRKHRTLPAGKEVMARDAIEKPQMIRQSAVYLPLAVIGAIENNREGRSPQCAHIGGRAENLEPTLPHIIAEFRRFGQRVAECRSNLAALEEAAQSDQDASKALDYLRHQRYEAHLDTIAVAAERSLTALAGLEGAAFHQLVRSIFEYKRDYKTLERQEERARTKANRENIR